MFVGNSAIWTNSAQYGQIDAMAGNGANPMLENRTPEEAKSPSLAAGLLQESRRPSVLRSGPLLTVKEAAERLNVCAATVYRMCWRGDLPHLYVSNRLRIVPTDLDALVTRP